MKDSFLYLKNNINNNRNDDYVYLPTKGKTFDVGGIFSATNIINTVIESKVVIPIVTFSPESDGM